MLVRAPAKAVVPMLVGVVITAWVLYALTGSGNPQALYTALTLVASLSFIGVLAAAFYFCLRWSGIKSGMASVGWWSLSVGCVLLLVDLALWPMSIVLIPFAFHVLGFRIRRWA